MATLDHPRELVIFLHSHLTPKEFEKKEHGEVFTPPSLIQEKFDALTAADPSVWSDPQRRFLDPANGIGNYPALAYQRLMEGLKEVIPDAVERKKHILENMLYMCELNPKNVEVSRQLFDPEGQYQLNLVERDFLELDTEAEWKVDAFDVVFGNPPYQPSSHGKKGGKSLWPLFVEKSIGLLREETGFLVFVHPALWRKQGNELHDAMFGRQIHTLHIHSSQDGNKLFQAGTRYDWYVLQNRAPVCPTSVRYDDGVESLLMITPSVPFLVNHGGDIMEKVHRKAPHGYLAAELTCEGHTQRSYIVRAPQEGYPYPVVNASSKANGVVVFWSSKALVHQYQKKVIFSNGGTIRPFYDVGVFGTTQGGIYIPVPSDAEGRKITRFLTSKVVSYIVGATKWSNFETNKQIFWSIPHPEELSEEMTDEEVYAYFGLSEEEVGRIEADQRGGGLATYVALEAPDVSDSPAGPAGPAVAGQTTEYHTLKVADLKRLCQERGVSGLSGKKKADLIAMLVSQSQSQEKKEEPVVVRPKKIRRPVLFSHV